MVAASKIASCDTGFTRLLDVSDRRRIAAVIGDVKSFRSYFCALFSVPENRIILTKFCGNALLALAINRRKSVRIIVQSVLSAKLPDTNICVAVVVTAGTSSTREVYSRVDSPPTEVFSERGRSKTLQTQLQKIK